MTMQKISYKDMAKLFTEHNKAKSENELIGVIVFHEKCFKSMYQEPKYRSYKVSSKNNAWLDNTINDVVIAYCLADMEDVMIFNVAPKMKVEYCYIVNLGC